MQSNFWAGSNNLCQTKSKIVFCATTKGFEKALNTVQFLGWLKKLGLSQNILGPVKGQGINQNDSLYWTFISCTF